MTTRTLSQTLFTGKRFQRVVIEYHDDHGPEWWVLFHNGDIETFDTASAAAKAVSKQAKRGNVSITVTQIEWRNVPEGWKPPTAA